jgi:hypothetical protein
MKRCSRTNRNTDLTLLPVDVDANMVIGVTRGVPLWGSFIPPREVSGQPLDLLYGRR